MKTVAFAIPGDLSTPTGGYNYDRRMIEELGQLGWEVEVLEIGEGFPRPTPEVQTIAGAQLMGLPAGTPIIIDGLAFGAMPDEAKALRARYPLVALVHHPLALETGLTSDEAAALLQSERAALACARHVITTSATTARLLREDYNVPPERLTVVRPGTDRVEHESHTPGKALTILAVGAVVPRKGYDVLIDALAKLKELAWRLVLVGDNTRSPETAAHVEEIITRNGLADRIEIVGSVPMDRLGEYYDAADLFVLPSRYEGYGMAYTEAIAHGVPVVGTTAGAIPDTVPEGAGVLVAPDDVEALAAALRRLLEDPAERERLAAGARKASTSFPTWPESAGQFAGVLDSLT